ncbi:aminopeptidase [Parasphaerochaeta coccoides]|uniref:Peptidase M29 aminopeptidase II n=1 Tax=Parasphaerochaeta coccoides (strain ATCC BAA-1237 / DSM 17374 / SPN1) TaxID=760011 RepID=F4GKT7_PARC1|nr:aminopeptidase [Parasphaerochaeta coccoides]AEC01850.1 peptidase M29 aminopeptidase II [Parasphaerochaeta coccoides DSM 17374]
MYEGKIDRYARLVLRKGINLKKGQNLFIKTGPGTYYFARSLAKCAYELGAGLVEFLLEDLDILSSRLSAQDDAEVQKYLPWQSGINESVIKDEWAYIAIKTTEDSLDHGPLDPDKYALFSKATRRVNTDVQRLRMTHQLPWCVVCVPGPRWAKQIFGSDDPTIDHLWQVIAPIVMIDKSDPEDAWDQKDIFLKKRIAILNEMEVDSLHFSSPVTDLVIGFNEKHRWLGGSSMLSDGRPFFPNIPTEEIFTVPDMTRAEGYVTSTRPVTVMDTPTEEVRFVFKNGRVVDFNARKGAEVIRKHLEVDEGSSRLGECALVDESNPIAASGLIFHSILYDENASCHIALGAGYPDCLEGGRSLVTDKELHEHGCNTSLMHTDFMIGSKETDVTAITRAGKEVPVIKKGHFVI